jgi:hypothetical protein
MMRELGNDDKNKSDKAKRAEHKFHKKGAKQKGRIKHAGVGEAGAYTRSHFSSA